LVRGSFGVTVNAIDDFGVTAIDLLVDGNLLASTPNVPAMFTVNSATLSDGTHQLQGRAFDAAGNAGASAIVTITVDNTAPAAAITSPAAGATVSGTISVAATASDSGSGVSRVEFLLDGAVQATVTTSPYGWSWNTTSATPGTHQLAARATDGAGNQTTSAAVSVTVSSGAGGSGGGGSG